METYPLTHEGAEIDRKLNAVDNKQDKLTAGDGIVISEDNVISTIKIYKHHLTCDCYDSSTNPGRTLSYTFYIFSYSSTPISTNTSLDVGDFIYGIGYHKDDETIYAPLIKKINDCIYLVGITYTHSGVKEDIVTPL